MVIACSKCQTRFHVEDARIPQEGVRVRCSKCKHAFFVRPPSAPADAGVHAAAEAALSGAPATPEPSFDLAGTTEAPEAAEPEIDVGGGLDEGGEIDVDSRIDPGIGSGEGIGGGGEDEDDWQFAIDPPSAATERMPTERPADDAELPTPSLAARMDARPAGGRDEPETSSLADLESPESWNLVGGHTAEASGLDAPVSDVFEQAEPDLAEDLPAVAPPVREPRERSRGLAIAAQALGWIALAGLLAVMGHGLRVAAQPAPATAVSAPVRVAGLEARDVRGRVVDNAPVGPLFVVTGTLANESPAPRAPERAIRVVLLDAEGRSLPRASLAGLPLPTREIRLQDPRELRGLLERSAAGLARRPLAAGEAVPFQAVFEGLDPAAVAFRLEEAPAPALPPPPPSGEEAAAEGSAPDAAPQRP